MFLFLHIQNTLCRTCAVKYQKDHEVAAALAYKCVEVACMRIVQIKSSTSATQRVWHDLHSSLRIAAQGMLMLYYCCCEMSSSTKGADYMYLYILHHGSSSCNHVHIESTTYFMDNQKYAT